MNDSDQSVEGVGGVDSVDQKNENGSVQLNQAGGNFAGNTATTVAAGGQLNLFMDDADQDVLAVGAQNSVNQKNRNATGVTTTIPGDSTTTTEVTKDIDYFFGIPYVDSVTTTTTTVTAPSTTVTSGGDQTNKAAGNLALNSGNTFAVGIQANGFMDDADQSVGATGALNMVDQSNKDAASSQYNEATHNGSINTGLTVAGGLQLNGWMDDSTQSVGATGAASLVSQSNHNSPSQLNAANHNGALNVGPTVAVGLQVNGYMDNSSQSVSAVGASAGVSQTNVNSVGN
jgi:hypothetical protein